MGGNKVTRARGVGGGDAATADTWPVHIAQSGTLSLSLQGREHLIKVGHVADAIVQPREEGVALVSNDDAAAQLRQAPG